MTRYWPVEGREVAAVPWFRTPVPSVKREPANSRRRLAVFILAVLCETRGKEADRSPSLGLSFKPESLKNTA